MVLSAVACDLWAWPPRIGIGYRPKPKPSPPVGRPGFSLPLPSPPNQDSFTLAAVRRRGVLRSVPNRPHQELTTGRHLAMAEPLVSSQDAPNPPASEQRVVVANRHGENLVGVLHHTGSNKVVVLCHGFTSSKDDGIILDLTAALTKQGISVFRFDFSGNGESEGEFQYGNYRKEADDLHSVVSYLCQEKYDVTAVVGHSKGGDVVVLYASIYGDVPMVINLSGRFDLKKGVEERLGKEFIDRINKEGYIDVSNKSGKFLYKVTKESLMERLDTDMRVASLSISKECRFFTIHGSADEIIPVEDAYEFAKLIPNHKLRIVEGANHCYTAHRKEISDAVVDSIKLNEAGDSPP